MAERSPGEGRYAHLEREQRWIVTEIPHEACLRAEIVDRYIHGTRLRIRRVTEADQVLFKLGQKVRVVQSDPERVKLTNMYLSAVEYEALAVLPASVLTKTRWASSWGGAELAIDQFHGHLSGLVLAEVELGPDDSVLKLPEFALRDVTHDDRFSGGSLATSAGAHLVSILTEATKRPAR